jgi:hypothetical protein
MSHPRTYDDKIQMIRIIVQVNDQKHIAHSWDKICIILKADQLR